MSIQLRRGLEADLTEVTLAAAEPAFCTDTLKLLIGDGEGGAVDIPNLAYFNANRNVRDVYVVSAASGADPNLTITDSNITQTEGLRVTIKSTTGDVVATSGQVWLKVNSDGAAHGLMSKDGEAITRLKSGIAYEFVHNGSQWTCVNWDSMRMRTGVENINANGYTKLPSGLIIQWGRQTATYATDSYLGPPANYAYPIAFPNAALTMISESSRPYLYNSTYGVLRAIVYYGGGSSADGKVYFNLCADHANNYVKAGSYSVGWICIGY